MSDTNYKWTLRHGGGKMICPNCGQKRFVPYVSTKDLQTLAGAEYGRCDREQNCGYNRYPGKEVDPGEINPVIVEKQPPLRFYSSAVVTDTRTPLFDYVAQLIGVSRALAIWNAYKIGRDGSRTVFWQIAADGTIRAGKSIPYKLDGHRDKSDPYPANWLHKSPAWRGYYSGAELQQCYFGEHLLRDKPNAKVIIVESEKTAAVMSAVSGAVWLASGGSQGLKNDEKNKVLKGRDVYLCPDNGMYWNWEPIARANGWNILDECEKIPLFQGYDVLDLLEAGLFGNIKK